MLRFQRHDGGRRAAGFRAPAAMGDCFVRAVAIASGRGYAEVHEAASRLDRPTGPDADSGMLAHLAEAIMRAHGFEKVETVPTSLDDSIFETGRFVVFASIAGKSVKGVPVGHAFAVIDGTILDQFDPRGLGIKIEEVWKHG